MTNKSLRESDLNPFLREDFAPWRVEGDAFGLEVEGEIPRDLAGTYYRNGPNPAFEPACGYHWFGGDGMIHAVTLVDGRASHKNRYVMGRGLAEERASGRPLYAGFAEPSTDKPRGKNVANTNIVAHAGRLLALVMPRRAGDVLHPRASRDSAWTGSNQARMHRFRVDLRVASVSSTPLDDVSVEFPRMDERRLGSPYRFGYVAAAGPEGRAERRPIWTAIRKYDFAKSTFETCALGEGNGASEPLFVPRSAGAAEDDGYVIFFAYDRARDASDLWVLDAANIAGEPVARVRLPHRVPYGFHGNWVSVG